MGLQLKSSVRSTQVETLSGDRLREIVAEYTPIPEKLAAV